MTSGFFIASRQTTRLVLAVLASSATLAAVRPELAFQTDLVYPRSSLTPETSLVWRGRLVARQQLGPRLSWSLAGDITAATVTRTAGLRLYTGALTYQAAPRLGLTLGRQVLWNNLQTSLFDGLLLGWNRGKFGDRLSLKVYAGVIPDTELRTDYGDAGTPVAGFIVQRTRGTARYGLQVWTAQLAGKTNLYLGGSFRRTFASRLTPIADLAFDIRHQRLEKVRLRLQYRLFSHASLYAQYRYAGQLTAAPYPWVAEPLPSKEAVSAGTVLPLPLEINLRLSIVRRLEEKPGTYGVLQISRGAIALTWQAQSQSLYEGQYVQLSGQYTLFGHTRVGATIGSSMYEISPGLPAYSCFSPDYYTVPRSALGAVLWFQGSATKHLNYRLFMQSTRNRYFKRDGRIGLQLTYEL